MVQVQIGYEKNLGWILQSYLFFNGSGTTTSYTYTNDLLTKITAGSTTYNFAYGNFGLRSSIKVGSTTLASYTYTDNQNKYLQKLAFGNGDSVQYVYDTYGRVTKETFEDGDTVTYKYDNTRRDQACPGDLDLYL